MIMPVVLGLLLMAIPFVFAVRHLLDTAYWVAVMSGWFSTIMGILVGVPFALWVSRWQQAAAETATSKREAEQQREMLRLVLHRLYQELEYNLGNVKQLEEIIQKARGVARVDHWRWACAVVNAFEFSVQEDLMRSALVPREKLVYYAEIDLAYVELKRLFHRVQQASAAHDFYYGYAGDEAAANWQLSELRAHVAIVKSTVEKSLDRRSGPFGGFQLSPEPAPNTTAQADA